MLPACLVRALARTLTLWHDLATARDARDAPIRWRNVKAHQDIEKFARSDASLRDFCGNHFADRLAARGAAENAVPYAASLEFHECQERTTLFLRRISIAMQIFINAHPEEEKRARVPREDRAAKRLLESGHCFRMQGRFAVCERCEQRIKKRACLLLEFFCRNWRT